MVKAVLVLLTLTLVFALDMTPTQSGKQNYFNPFKTKRILLISFK
jgi:hypothetical protein